MATAWKESTVKRTIRDGEPEQSRINGRGRLRSNVFVCPACDRDSFFLFHRGPQLNSEPLENHVYPPEWPAASLGINGLIDDGGGSRETRYQGAQSHTRAHKIRSPSLRHERASEPLDAMGREGKGFSDKCSVCSRNTPAFAKISRCHTHTRTLKENQSWLLLAPEHRVVLFTHTKAKAKNIKKNNHMDELTHISQEITSERFGHLPSISSLIMWMLPLCCITWQLIRPC